MAQGALQKISLILDQPLSGIILDPEAKAWDPDPATLHELIKDREDVAMDVIHAAKQCLQLFTLHTEHADVKHQVAANNGPSHDSMTLF